MPAIRITGHFGLTTVSPVPCGRKVPVRQKSGQTVSVEFLGFICQKGAAIFPHSRFVKIAAQGVSKDNGGGFGESAWRYLKEGEFVVGCMVQRPPESGGVGICVYGVLDDTGWPMVRGGNTPTLSLACA